ncbi:hypothetical protein BDZ94DRAFT_1275179 [Collybia nuda]|uniref:Uncharacterized protein n=1 Tax=Collybia nuda TaxID=64659 RepID=A0A9P5XVT2_9AGAR|nr:hypothetical protein BDZ94DRAFT_1275179 [Collybia nuda]
MIIRFIIPSQLLLNNLHLLHSLSFFIEFKTGNLSLLIPFARFSRGQMRMKPFHG